MNTENKIEVHSCLCCNGTQQSSPFADWQGNWYVTCGECGSVYQNLRSISLYDENYWGVITDPDGNSRDLRTERASKLKNWYCGSVPFVNSQPPGKILDVGAGLGYFLSAINSDWERHALDVSDFSLQFINEEFPEIHTHKGVLGKSTFPTENFDIVIFYHVIEHLEQPSLVLDTIYNILKPGGIVIVGTPNINSFTAKYFKGNFRLYCKEHLCLFSSKSLEWLLKQHKFEIIQKEYPYWSTDYVNLKNIMRLLNRKVLSPPFWGNIMTFYAKKIAYTSGLR
jgi:2-polyprenyl-3-methyl-5-hydroxy-6-metoxy-1,4-benzoquinol methylase